MVLRGPSNEVIFVRIAGGEPDGKDTFETGDGTLGSRAMLRSQLSGIGEKLVWIVFWGTLGGGAVW